MTVSGVVVTNCKTGQQAAGVDVAKQWFKPIPEGVMDELIAKGDVMYCCGGFLIDDPLIEPYLDRREGDADSIIGLPMRLLLDLWRQVDPQAPGAAQSS